MNNFSTIYLTPDCEPTEQDLALIERLTNVELSSGPGFVNVYTLSELKITAVADMLGRHNIEEISYE
jgi:hypothetical protein